MRATNGRARTSGEAVRQGFIDCSGDDDACWVPEWSAREIQERWEALLARVLEVDLEDELSPPPRLTLIQGGRDA